MREFLWSEDMADACIHLMEEVDFKNTYDASTKEFRNTHINIGTGKEISIAELAKTIKKAVKLVEQAASDDAELVVFPEAYISGYPAWIWRLRPGGDWGTTEELHARLFNSAVDIDAGDLQPLCDSAKKNKLTNIFGLNEKDSKLSEATVYNTVERIGAEWKILNCHRKSKL